MILWTWYRIRKQFIPQHQPSNWAASPLCSRRISPWTRPCRCQAWPGKGTNESCIFRDAALCAERCRGPTTAKVPCAKHNSFCTLRSLRGRWMVRRKWTNMSQIKKKMKINKNKWYLLVEHASDEEHRAAREHGFVHFWREFVLRIASKFSWRMGSTSWFFIALLLI